MSLWCNGNITVSKTVVLGSSPSGDAKSKESSKMNITIVNVDVTTPAGKKYQQAEVVFKDDGGKVNTKKIFSFANPAVFDVIKGAKSGEAFSVTTVKNDKGYWDWTAATACSAAPAAPASYQRSATPAPTRDFETKEERAQRQRLIVRQSSISNAISMLTPSAKQSLAVADVLAVAEQLNNWVFEPAALTFDSMEDDIPY